MSDGNGNDDKNLRDAEQRIREALGRQQRNSDAVIAQIREASSAGNQHIDQPGTTKSEIDRPPDTFGQPQRGVPPPPAVGMSPTSRTSVTNAGTRPAWTHPADSTTALKMQEPSHQSETKTTLDTQPGRMTDAEIEQSVQADLQTWEAIQEQNNSINHEADPSVQADLETWEAIKQQEHGVFAEEKPESERPNDFAPSRAEPEQDQAQRAPNQFAPPRPEPQQQNEPEKGRDR